MSGGWHSFTTLPEVDPAKVKSVPKNLPSWQDAIENFIIGYGMGWDLAGLLQALVDALPEDSSCKSIQFVTEAELQADE